MADDEKKDMVPAPQQQALSRRAQNAEKRIARLRRLKEQLDQRDARILAAARRAAELDDGVKQRPEGWTPLEFRVARDARKPSRNAPVYLALAQSRDAAKIRAEAQRPPSPSKVAVIVLPAQKSYDDRPVINVTADGVVIDVESAPKKED